MRLFLALTYLVAAGALALEGGSSSRSPEWRNVKPRRRPDAATRARELAARKEAIAAEIARLKARLKRVPSAEKLAELDRKLQAIHKNYGWVPELKVVYGRRCIEPMLKKQDRLPANLLAAFVQLNKDLKTRGIDLILLPLVPSPHFSAHLLVDGLGPEDEYYPGWTKMMIQMLENDLEVVDSVDEFRQAAGKKMLVSWANDFHTGSLGRQIAARKLAARLQRYDFARELKENRKLWTVTVKTRKGASLPQRILVVNGAIMDSAEYWQRREPGLKRWQAKKKGPIPADAGLILFKGKRGVSALRPDVPRECAAALRNLEFEYMVLKFRGNAAQLRRTELVMIGDSQLHSNVYGSGLPEFIMAEVGGIFRWGSKSWGGFSPPEIYREVVPDDAVQPRVVVLAFLPKYFWHHYDRQGRIDEKACKYKPRPLPPLKTGAAAAGPAVKGEQQMTVKITRVSRRPQEDPKLLDYDRGILHVAAVVTKGALKGKEIGLRYWILYDRAWTRADGKVKPGQTYSLGLTPWEEVIQRDPKLGRQQTFDTTDQDMDIPLFWVTSGRLSPAELLRRKTAGAR